MRMIKIEPVAKPKTFDGSHFTVAAWEAATARGPVEVPYGTALEAVRNSNGLYRMVEEAEEAAVASPALSVDAMDDLSLKLTAASLGLTLKKKMKRADLVDLVKRRLDAVELVDDDEGDDDEVGEG